MSRIPAKELLSKEDQSTRSSVDPILNSPYTTTYQKPLRILKVDSNGNSTLETSTTTYRSVNEPVSLDKITQICENIITDKMLSKEKSLMSQLLYTIGDNLLEIEKRLYNFVSQNIDDKINEKHIHTLEKKLNASVTDYMRVMTLKLEDKIESND